jgi:hypothetical protein
MARTALGGEGIQVKITNNDAAVNVHADSSCSV